MSQDRLIRSLLYDVLRQCKDLLPSDFPDLREAQYLFHEYQATPLSRPELMRALKTAVKLGSKSRKFLFFIDGLYEFAGSYTDQPSSLVNSY